MDAEIFGLNNETRMTSNEHHQLRLCVALACHAHEGQTDKGGQPYIGHPLRVMKAVNHPHEKMAAVLHDIVEDTWVTFDILHFLHLPRPVVRAIECLTKSPGESYEGYLGRVTQDPLAARVKVADLIDNLNPSRLALWRALNPKSADRYADAARTRLATLCVALNIEIPPIGYFP